MRSPRPGPNCCPDEEGIKTRAAGMLDDDTVARVRIAALMKKGLRHISGLRAGMAQARPNCCPDEEGIKTRNRARERTRTRASVRIAALMKKGLRLAAVGPRTHLRAGAGPNCCPDEEGIKTRRPGRLPRHRCCYASELLP